MSTVLWPCATPCCTSTGRTSSCPEGSFFLADLMGMEVRDAASGAVLGKIADVLTLPANNVYVVRGGARELDDPRGGPEFIAEVNVDEGLPPGQHDGGPVMRRTVLYISMSLDGCLARPDGDVSWLAGQDPDDPDPGTYPAFLSTVDTVVMGWTTYHQVVTQLSPGSWPYRGLDCYVAHPTAPLPPQTEKIQAFSGPAHQLVEQLKREPAGRDIWICGGADTAAQLESGKTPSTDMWSL